MPRKKTKGAQPANANALKHGFYSLALDEAERLKIREAADMDGLDEEIALFRLKLRLIIENHPDRLDLQAQAATILTRMIKTRYQISKEQKKSLKDAIANVLQEIAAPLGVGIGVGVGMKTIR